MTKPFAKLLSRVSESPYEFKASTLTFPSLDVPRLAKKLDLEKRGKVRGEEGKPAPDVGTFDAVENEIVSAVLDQRKSTVEAATRNLETYGERLRALDFEGRLTEIRAEVQNALGDYTNRIQSGENALYGKRREVVERTRAVLRP